MGTDDLSKCRKLSGTEAETHLGIHMLSPLHKFSKRMAKGSSREARDVELIRNQFVREVLDEIERGNMALVIGPPTRPHST